MSKIPFASSCAVIGHTYLRCTHCLCSRRILWEPLGSRDSSVALIWDVVKHKSMRRQAKYIDDADRPDLGTSDVFIVDYRDNSRANMITCYYLTTACRHVSFTLEPRCHWVS